MSSAPSISIITPVLNGRRYLSETLESIAAQDFEDWEHILVDSGSNDGSLEIIDDWCVREPRARLIRNEQAGLYASIVEGLQAAKGTCLAWLNSDDLYLPWAFRSVWRRYEETGDDWLTGLPGCWDRNGALRYVRPYGAYPRRLIRKGWFHERLLGFLQQESIFFSRKLFEKLGTEDLRVISACRLAGDYVLWTRLARHAPLKVIPAPLSGFRMHGENLSSANLEAYLSEVREHGGQFLPAPLASSARFLFQHLSAAALIGQVATADQSVHRDISF